MLVITRGYPKHWQPWRPCMAMARISRRSSRNGPWVGCKQPWIRWRRSWAATDRRNRFPKKDLWVGATAMENSHCSGPLIEDLPTENGDFCHVSDGNFRIAGVTHPVHLIRGGHLVLAGGVASAGKAGPWMAWMTDDDGMRHWSESSNIMASLASLL